MSMKAIRLKLDSPYRIRKASVSKYIFVYSSGMAIATKFIDIQILKRMLVMLVDGASKSIICYSSKHFSIHFHIPFVATDYLRIFLNENALCVNYCAVCHEIACDIYERDLIHRCNE